MIWMSQAAKDIISDPLFCFWPAVFSMLLAWLSQKLIRKLASHSMAIKCIQIDNAYGQSSGLPSSFHKGYLLVQNVS